MPNIITNLAEGAAKGLFSGLGDFFVKTRQAIVGLEIDPNKKAELESKLAELEIEAQKLQNDAAKITVEDRSSARVRETEIRKAGGKDNFPKFLDTLAVLAFVGCLAALFSKVVPDGTAKEVLLVLIGTLVKIVSDIYGYYRGSSAGSESKTTAMADALKELVGKK